MENLSADFVQFSWAIVKYLFLEERLDTMLCLHSILRLFTRDIRENVLHRVLIYCEVKYFEKQCNWITENLSRRNMTHRIEVNIPSESNY